MIVNSSLMTFCCDEEHFQSPHIYKDPLGLSVSHTFLNHVRKYSSYILSDMALNFDELKVLFRL